MRGAFQYQNAAAAIAALRALRQRLPMPVNAIRAGLGRARLAGRFQVIPGQPTWILDVAHNREAALALAGNLRGFLSTGRLRVVLGVLADKEPEFIAAPLAPLAHDWVLTASTDPRAMPPDQLAGRLAGVLGDSQVQVVPGVEKALEVTRAASAPGDCVLVCGSFTTVGEALSMGGKGGGPVILSAQGQDGGDLGGKSASG
jgi:dihydrofolate synthase/folylpolyglutamate synthase